MAEEAEGSQIKTQAPSLSGSQENGGVVELAVALGNGKHTDTLIY